MRIYRLFHITLMVMLLLTLSACSRVPIPAASPSSQLIVVATTTLVGDVVRHIGGNVIQLKVLLPVGSDPHSFVPTPQDAALLAQADLIIANGAGLEEFLDRLLESAASNTPVVHASEGITLIELHEEDAHEGEESAEHTGEEEHTHEGGDPHVWMDPNLVLVWVDNIEKALVDKDPANAPTFQSNAAAYRKQLAELDGWIRQQVELVPQANRRLVTDHRALAYFAERYGFEQVGAVLPGYSSLAEPSAQELATLEDTILSLGVKAVFVGASVNPSLAQRVADDTKVQLVMFYTGSLSEADEPASSYLDFMRYNVGVIVEALK